MSMADDVPTDEPSGEQPPEPSEIELGSSRVPTMGVDESGATHYFDVTYSRVIVVDADGDVEHVQTGIAPGADYRRWEQRVADERGWEKTPDDLLVEDLRRAAGMEDN